MGFTVYYRSIESVEAETRQAIANALDDLCQGRTWLSCEPPGFFGGTGNHGFLQGGSKPNFLPHADEIADANLEGLPDGTIQDVVEVLCKLSAEFGIDWQFSHDQNQGPIGFIRDGIADAALQNEVIGIASIGMAVADAMESMPIQSRCMPRTQQYDADDGPKILKFGPLTDVP